jgi:hypothetical protein
MVPVGREGPVSRENHTNVKWLYRKNLEGLLETKMYFVQVSNVNADVMSRQPRGIVRVYKCGWKLRVDQLELVRHTEKYREYLR